MSRPLPALPRAPALAMAALLLLLPLGAQAAVLGGCNVCSIVVCPPSSSCAVAPPCSPLCLCAPGYRAVGGRCVGGGGPSPVPVGAGKGSGGVSASACLPLHNSARAAVKVPPLKWSTAAASNAQAWASQLAAGGRCLSLVHGGLAGMGQNLYGSSGPSTCAVAVKAWTDEAALYSYSLFDAPGGSGCSTGRWEDCGHYTQVVWRATTAVGCGMATCAGGGSVWACDYTPAGNVVGEYPY